jgi:DNA-binding transcriptional regulator YiaG
MMIQQTDIDRFWSKVNKDGPIIREELGPCWIWTAGTFDVGYGSFWWEGINIGAHVFAFVLREGKMPAIGLMVLHHCDQRLCVRHTYEGTHADNIHDMDARGRRNTENQRAAVAKLDAQQVLDIREYYARGDVTQHVLAETFGVSLMTINKIVRRLTWAHLP